MGMYKIQYKYDTQYSRANTKTIIYINLIKMLNVKGNAHIYEVIRVRKPIVLINFDDNFRPYIVSKNIIIFAW